MPRRTLARLLSAAVAGLAAGAFAACSDQSPVGPHGPAPGAVQKVSVLAQPVSGEGDISFIPNSIGERNEVILVAQVTAEGNPAQGGQVLFQFCASRGSLEFGFPTIPLPSAECEPGGSGRWFRIGTVPVVAGEASVTFCCISSGSTIGFRFVYTGQGSGIGNFTSLPEDYTQPA